MVERQIISIHEGIQSKIIDLLDDDEFVLLMRLLDVIIEIRRQKKK